MKILVISPFYPPYIGGVEVIAQAGASALVSLGHSVIVFTSAGPDMTEEISRGEDGVDVHRISALHPHNEDGQSVAAVVSYLSELLEHTHIDVVHSHLLTYPWMPLRSEAIQLCLNGIPIVDQAHGGDFEHRATTCIALMKSVNHLICDSNYVLDRTQRMLDSHLGVQSRDYFSADFMSVLYPTLLDQATFSPSANDCRLERERLKIDTDTFVILFPSRFFDIDGNFSSRKRPLVALEAYAKFVSKTEGKALLLAILPPGFWNRESEHDSRRLLQQRVRQLGIEHCSMFLNTSVLHESMAAVFTVADVTLVPSVEGFGLVHLESMACGVPVVTVKEGAACELLDDTSALWVPNDGEIVKTISGALEDLYHDQLLAKDMGRAARQRFLSTFNRRERWIADLETRLRLHAR